MHSAAAVKAVVVGGAPLVVVSVVVAGLVRVADQILTTRLLRSVT